jgi:ubiquinone/menaquinone biosynthesis C-methylase UbiE
MDDLPRKYVIRESSHRIHNPFTSENLATLGRALYLPAGTSMLDLACGSGEMLCTWARDHELTGTGVDISTAFIEAAQARARQAGRRGPGHVHSQERCGLCRRTAGGCRGMQRVSSP